MRLGKVLTSQLVVVVRNNESHKPHSLHERLVVVDLPSNAAVESSERKRIDETLRAKTNVRRGEAQYVRATLHVLSIPNYYQKIYYH